jgi:hypothetical protein
VAKFMTSRAEEYRRYARQCLEIAPTFQDEEARATLLQLAQAWLRLAESYHDFMRPAATELARPVVQQQQQIQPNNRDLAARQNENPARFPRAGPSVKNPY